METIIFRVSTYIRIFLDSTNLTDPSQNFSPFSVESFWFCFTHMASILPKVLRVFYF